MGYKGVAGEPKLAGMIVLGQVIGLDDNVVVGFRKMASKGGEDRLQFGLGGVMATSDNG